MPAADRSLINPSCSAVENILLTSMDIGRVSLNPIMEIEN